MVQKAGPPLLDLAAVQVLPEAVRNRDGAAGHMSPVQLAEAQKLAREWQAKHQKE
jgi:hypothetical protein